MKKLLAALGLAAVIGVWGYLELHAIRKAVKPFSFDAFEVVSLEYADPHTIVGVTAYGPTDKGEVCGRALAADIAQGNQMPGGHKYGGTCLHISFKGPIHGQVILQPPVGNLLEYIPFAAGFTASGALIGIDALKSWPDAKTCKAQGNGVIERAYQNGKIPTGGSLLIYCLPIPVLPSDKDANAGDV